MDSTTDEDKLNVPMEVECPSSEGEKNPEDKLLESSESEDEACSKSCAGEPSGSPARPGDAATETDSMELLRKTKRKERKRERRRQARLAERQERRQQREEAAGASQPASTTPLQAGRPSTASAGPSRPGGKSRAAREKEGERGPSARRDRGAARREPLVLPKAPASLLGARSQTSPKGSEPRPKKRLRSDNNTPPERTHKRSATGTGSGGRAAGTSSSGLRTTSEPNRQAIRKKFQAVVRSNRPGGRVEEEEVTALRGGLVAEMRRAMLKEKGLHLRFRNSGIVKPGWFLITAEDEPTWRWLLTGWSPQEVGGVTFTLTREEEAPWPVEIGFSIRSQEPVNIREVQEMLALQNGNLAVPAWEHQQTTGGPGGWWVIFRVSREDARSIEEAGWVLHYELITLAVRRVRLWGSQPTTKGPGTSKQA